MSYREISREELIEDNRGLLKKLAQLEKTHLPYKTSEEALRRGEIRYEAGIEPYLEMFVRYRPDLSYVYINEVYASYFGCQLDQLRDKDVLFFVPAGYQEEVRQLIYALTPEKPVFTHEHMYPATGRTVNWRQWMTWAIFGDDGKVIEYQSLGRDISERKWTELELRRRLAVEEAIADCSRLLVGQQEADLNKILEIVGRAAAVNRVGIFALDDKRNMASYAYEWCDDDAEPLIDKVKDINTGLIPWSMEILSDGRSVIISDTENLPPAANYEKGLLRDFGVYSMLEVAIRDSKHNLIGSMAFADTRDCRQWREEDIRCLQVVAEMLGASWERVKMEQNLLESEIKFRQLAEMTPALTYITNMHESQPLLYVNDSVIKQSGYSATELSNMNPWKIVYPEDMEMLLQRGWARLRGESVQDDYEVRFVTKDGSITYGLLSARPIQWEGQEALITVIYDISERRAMEEQVRQARDELETRVRERTAQLVTVNMELQQEIAEKKQMEAELQKQERLQSLGDLAGGIAHDFNNILTVVSGNASLGKMIWPGEANDEIPVLLEEIETAALQASKLTGQLLTFSRGGAPVKAIVPAREIAMEAVDFALATGNNSCTFSLGEALWPVEVDKEQINQVFYQLIRNACQSMLQGGEIRIEAENIILDKPQGVLDRGEYVRLTVTDQGMGIDEAILGKIFDPYFTTKEMGQGMGLALAYSIIKRHGGDITVKSKPAEGTAFIVYLPASDKTITQRAEEEIGSMGGHGRILVMDDEEYIRVLLGRMLKQLGYEADWAEDGQEAIDIYAKALQAERPFDAVIMDLTVPGAMGGAEAVQELQKIDPALKAIVSSGYHSDPVMADYTQYGFIGVMTKPYDIIQLNRILNQVLAS